MTMGQYGLQQTMFKAENSQMFQNQFIIQDRGGQEHQSRRVQDQNDQKMQEVAEGEASDEDSSTVGTDEEGGSRGGAPWRAPMREEDEEELGEQLDQESIILRQREAAAGVGRTMEGKGFRVDIQA